VVLASVTFFLSILGQLARDVARNFVLLLGLWTVVALLQLVRNHPMLSGSLSWSLVLTLATSAAVPCALAALTIAVSQCFAQWGQRGELAGAAAVGLGPMSWIAPVLALATAITPWTLHSVDELYPAARAAKHIATRMALRSPAGAAALFSSRSDLLPGALGRFDLGADGDLANLSGVVLGDGGRPARVWRASAGSVSVPDGRDVLRVRLSDVVVWSNGGDGLERYEVGELELNRPMPQLSERRSGDARSKLRESTLGELSAAADGVSHAGNIEQGDALSPLAARTDWCARLALAFAPIPLSLAALALGLWAARWGRWAGSLAGLILVGVVFLPLQSATTRAALSTGLPWLTALPALVIAVCSLPALRRWRLL
jgi:lipopolysaccharide export LptBFGC system permease protein LptF